MSSAATNLGFTMGACSVFSLALPLYVLFNVFNFLAFIILSLCNALAAIPLHQPW